MRLAIGAASGTKLWDMFAIVMTGLANTTLASDCLGDTNSTWLREGSLRAPLHNDKLRQNELKH